MLSLATVLILAACALTPTDVRRLSPGPLSRSTDGPICDQPCGPETYPNGVGHIWNYFAAPGDELYQAASDPSPGSPGLWLGSTVVPATCFNDLTRTIVDADHDWLDDNCELELARGFAPTWGMSDAEACPGGEPLWAAKYFSTFGIVRIVYMPANYKDCGPLGHNGDSEFVIVEVKFNTVTQHWEFQREFLSAHLGDIWPGIDRSEWVSNAEFTRRPLSHPRVAVSIDKHSNFGSDAKCLNAFAVEVGGEAGCGIMIGSFRFPVDAHRNVGSRFQDLLGGCIGSIGSFAGNGFAECFYSSNKNFAGWQSSSGGATAYQTLLNDYFERYLTSDPTVGTDPLAWTYDWGPGPAAAVLVRANIAGPTQISASGTYTWTASATNCNPGCTYQWRRSTDNVTWFTIGTGTSVSLFYGANSPQSLILELTAYTNPTEANATRRIIVNRISGGTTCGGRIC
jgi:hypothetical protein